MRKSILFLIAALLISLAGCSTDETLTENSSDYTSVSDSVPEPQSQFSRNGDFIRINEKNLFSFDFVEFQGLIEDIIKAKGNKISMPFMYGLPAVDIYFTPSGEIMKFDMSLYAYMGESGNDLIMSQYKIRNNSETETDKFQTMPQVFTEDISTMTGLDVHLHEKNSKWLNWVFEDAFVYEKFPAFMEWANNFDFKDVIQKYKVGEPVRYEFLAGMNIQREIIDNEDINCIFLDCSSGTPVQVQYEDIPSSNPDYFPYEPTTDASDRSAYLDYYVIIPYYHADQMDGFPHFYIYSAPEDLSDGKASYYSDPIAYEIGYEKYTVNNIILLFPNGLGKSAD